MPLKAVGNQRQVSHLPGELDALPVVLEGLRRTRRPHEIGETRQHLRFCPRETVHATYLEALLERLPSLLALTVRREGKAE